MPELLAPKGATAVHGNGTSMPKLSYILCASRLAWMFSPVEFMDIKLFVGVAPAFADSPSP